MSLIDGVTVKNKLFHLVGGGLEPPRGPLRVPKPHFADECDKLNIMPACVFKHSKT